MASYRRRSEPHRTLMAFSVKRSNIAFTTILPLVCVLLDTYCGAALRATRAPMKLLLGASAAWHLSCLRTRPAACLGDRLATLP
jgi:hypothetical protein